MRTPSLRPRRGLRHTLRQMGREWSAYLFLAHLYFTGGSVPLTMTVGLLIALLLNQPIRLRGMFRTMYFLPVVTPLVVTAI